MENTLFLRFIKFAVVGTISFFLDFGTTYLFKEKIKLNQYIANTFGFIVAASFNFTLNKFWSFQNHADNLFLQFAEYVGSMSVGLVLASYMIYYLNEKKGYNFYLSKVLSVSISMIWNFFMNNYIVFAN